MREIAVLRVLSVAAFFAVLMAISLAAPESVGATSVAFADEVRQLKPKPNPKKKRVVAKPRVVANKGKVKGTYNVLGDATRTPGPPSRPWSGASSDKKKISAEDQEVIGALCWKQIQDLGCLPTAGPSTTTSLTGPLARAMAVNLVATLRFPAPEPIFGPDPNNNEWKMLAVGFPVWMWTEGPTTVSTSASSSGYTFRMTARWRSTTFHMGDGASVTCTSMTKYSASVKPGTASPNCGHVYTKPSLPKGKYTVRAVADWDVTWSVAGFSGVLPAYNEASASIPIGELVALNR